VAVWCILAGFGGPQTKIPITDLGSSLSSEETETQVTSGRVSLLRLTLLALCLALPPCVASGQAQQKPLTDADIVAMVQGGLAESTIIGAIRTQESNFDVSASALIHLQRRGVSPNVMRAMLNAAKKEAAPSPAPPEGEPAYSGSSNPGTSEAAFPKSVPLTSYAMDLLAIRDNPQLIDDIALKLAETQIQVEQQVWRQIYSTETYIALNPKRPTFMFEWQKLITERPELARGPLLDVFLSPNADWSFVNREPGWDDRYNAIVEPFIFSKEAIEGRNPEFAAHDLLSVMKQFLKLAASKAPTDFWLKVNLPDWQYDFNAKAIRFNKPGTNGFIPTVNLLRPMSSQVFTPPPKSSRDYATVLPPSARSTINYGFYTFDGRNALPAALPETKPGVEMQSPDQRWREALPTSGASPYGPHPFPDPLGLALDRQLTISEVPMDAKRAERLMNGQSLTGPQKPNSEGQVRLKARVCIHVDQVMLGEDFYEGKSTPFSFLVAHLQKVEILGLHDELIAGFGPERFRGAKEVLAADAAAREKAIAEAKEKQAQEAAHRLQVQKAFEEQMNRNKEEVRRQSEEGVKQQQQKLNEIMKQMQASERKQLECTARAYKAAHAVELGHGDIKESSKVYNNTLNACMKGKSSESK
jgi:hypothetical protein